jgi:hypothetical protein
LTFSVTSDDTTSMSEFERRRRTNGVIILLLANRVHTCRYHLAIFRKTSSNMTARKLTVEPLTQQASLPFGDVIETDQRPYRMINSGSTQRYHALASVELAHAAEAAFLMRFSCKVCVAHLACRCTLWVHRGISSRVCTVCITWETKGN